jgi:hypothetical protein
VNKIITIVKGLVNREVTIDIVKKTHISKAPGEVTEMSHN